MSRTQTHRREPAAERPAWLTRAAEWLVSALEAYTAVLMLMLAVIVLLGVWFRYVVQRALPWYDEFAEFLLVWLTFYGSALAAHRGAHIGFETLTDTLPPAARRAAAIFAEGVVLFVLIALWKYGWTLAQVASFDTALSIRAVRLSWIYSAIPLSAGLMVLIELRRLAALVRR